MPTPATGTKAPLFTLKTMDGEACSLTAALEKNALVVAAFFKISCPVCQMTLPYLERLHRAYPTVPIWGVSQDDMDATRNFARMYGVTFPMLLDETLSATVEYDLVTVPSTFAIGSNGNIEQAIFGFAKADLEELNNRMAAAAKTAPKPLFTEADDVPVLRPG